MFRASQLWPYALDVALLISLACKHQHSAQRKDTSLSSCCKHLPVSDWGFRGNGNCNSGNDTVVDSAAG